jgi:hypothetical protein
LACQVSACSRPAAKPPLPTSALDLRQAVSVHPFPSPEPATVTELAAGAGLPDLERTLHATRAPLRMEADALTVRTGTEQALRWQFAAAHHLTI